MSKQMASHEMGFDDFLDHSGTASGAGFLKNWKDDGSIDVWLHPKATVAVLWSHGGHRIDAVTDRKTGAVTRQVRGVRWNCLEKEVVLKKQRFRNDDDSREYPPQVCPHCLAQEWIRSAIQRGDISWIDPLFIFEGDDPEQDPVTIFAGGWCGLFQLKKEDYSREQLAELRKAGVRRDEAYLQSGIARMQYVLRVVQNSDPGDGALIAIESQALGDKLKKEVKKRMVDLGEDGDPRVKPYAFRWTYDENKEFSDKYDVTVLSKLPVTDEIQAAFNEEPPSIQQLVEPPNLATMRSVFERYCQIQGIPWDEIFAPAEQLFGKSSRAEDEEEQDDDPLPEVGGSDEAATGDDDDLIACDICETGMAADQAECPECGATYDETGLVSRPCGNCKTQTPVASPTCPKCGAVHEPRTWKFQLAKPAAAPPGRRLRSQAAPAKEADADPPEPAARKPRRQAMRESGKSGA